jgi:hypothetical protein
MLKITGLDNLKKKLDDFSQKAKALDGTHSVPIEDLLTPSFISRHTRFADVDEFFAASGFKVESQEDLDAIPDDKWDEYVRSVSSFHGWEAMLGEAGKEWAATKLGFR